MAFESLAYAATGVAGGEATAALRLYNLAMFNAQEVLMQEMWTCS